MEVAPAAWQDLDGLVAVPSLSHPHFMEAHYLATQVGPEGIGIESGHGKVSKEEGDPKSLRLVVKD